MKTTLTPKEEFLLQAFAENRVAQICVHNEYSMIHYDTVEGTEARRILTAGCNDVAAFTRQMSPDALTVRTQYDIAMTNEVRRNIAAHRDLPFNEYYPKNFLSYDRVNMKVKPKGRSNHAYIDLIDPDFNDYVLIGDESDVLDGVEGERLARLLHTNKRDVILGYGMYAHACTKKFLHHALKDNFVVYAVTDRILNHPWNEKFRDKHEQIIASYDEGIHRIESEKVLKLAKMRAA